MKTKTLLVLALLAGFCSLASSVVSAENLSPEKLQPLVSPHQITLLELFQARHINPGPADVVESFTGTPQDIKGALGLMLAAKYPRRFDVRFVMVTKIDPITKGNMPIALILCQKADEMVWLRRVVSSRPNLLQNLTVTDLRNPAQVLKPEFPPEVLAAIREQ
jgi:hypothetical protein